MTAEGQGHVIFLSPDDATACIAACNGVTLEGSPIVVEFTKPGMTRVWSSVVVFLCFFIFSVSLFLSQTQTDTHTHTHTLTLTLFFFSCW